MIKFSYWSQWSCWISNIKKIKTKKFKKIIVADRKKLNLLDQKSRTIYKKT